MVAAEIREVGVGQEAATPWVVRWATGTDLDARLLYALPASAEVRVVATPTKRPSSTAKNEMYGLVYRSSCS
ncbi:hypothetical protein [Streptomyces sp. NPDC001480]|uniref:hypothetical protein n=1 Tax=Streptomyces sp. NPDC001480 TaxID=3364577 RepID=UPI0036A6EE16